MLEAAPDVPALTAEIMELQADALEAAHVSQLSEFEGMADNERSVGQLFSHIYLERGDPTQDSVVARARFGEYIQNNEFITELPIKVLLNTLTLVFRHLWQSKHKGVNRLAEAPVDPAETATSIMPRHSKAHVAASCGSPFPSPSGLVEMVHVTTSPPALDSRDFVRRVLQEENLGYGWTSSAASIL